MTRYGSFDQVSDEEIFQQFHKAEIIFLLMGGCSYLRFRKISFGDLGWLPLIRVLPVIKVSPEMLRPVFDQQLKVVRRNFPFNLSWFGLNSTTVKVVKTRLPLKPESYEQLGAFILKDESFKKLPQIFGKPIKFLQEDKKAGSYCHVFAVRLNGDIVLGL